MKTVFQQAAGLIRSAFTQSADSPLQGWSFLAWLGSFGMGLSAFLTAAIRVRPVYHAFQDIVATPAFLLYPEQQDVWFYALAVTVIPLFTILGYLAWRLVAWTAGRLGGELSTGQLAAITFWNFVWWIRPFSWAFAAIEKGGAVEILLVVFLLGNSLILGQAWLEKRGKAAAGQSPPEAAWHMGLVLIGCAVGLGWTQIPGRWTANMAPGAVFTAGIIVVWGIWLGASFILAGLLKKPWRAVGESLAVGLLPLFTCAPVGLVWSEVYQEGQLVASRGSMTAAVALMAGAAAVSALLAWRMVRGRLVDDALQRKKLFWRGALWLGVPVLLYGLFYSPNIHGALDVFHEGESLAPAAAILDGQVPYRDVLFVHGFLRDPGVAMAAFFLGDENLASLRQLNTYLFPLIVIANYFVILLLVQNLWALPITMLMFTSVWPMFFEWRLVPALMSLFFLLAYLRKNNWRWSFLAGCFTFLALLTSTDTGIVALAASSVVIILYTAFHYRDVRMRLLFSYAAPLLAGGGAVSALLAAQQALLPFARWNLEILQVYRDWNGMPFPFPPQNLQQAWDALLSPLASILVMIVLATRLVRGRWKTAEWQALLLLGTNLMMFNRGLVSGAAGGSALEAGSHFAPFLFLMLILPLKGASEGRERWVMAGLIGLLLLPLPGKNMIVNAIDLGGQRNRVDLPADWRLTGLERMGAVYVPASQADSLQAIVPVLEKTGSYWDFSDHPALYFLSGHNSPARYNTTHHLITADNQRELIQALKDNPPDHILFRSSTGWNSIAGIDRVLRSFLVAEYLLKNYHLESLSGGFTLLAAGASTAPDDRLAFRVDMGAVPLLWGRDRLADLLTYPARTAEPCIPGQDASEANSFTWLCSLDPRTVTYLALQMETDQKSAERLTAVLSWRAAGEDFVEQRKVTFEVIPDSGSQVYLIRLASVPAWVWHDDITGLKLVIEGGYAGQITLQPLQFLALDELE